jgi:hypothetical protein
MSVRSMRSMRSMRCYAIMRGGFILSQVSRVCHSHGHRVVTVVSSLFQQHITKENEHRVKLMPSHQSTLNHYSYVNVLCGP